MSINTYKLKEIADHIEYLNKVRKRVGKEFYMCWNGLEGLTLKTDDGHYVKVAIDDPVMESFFEKVCEAVDRDILTSGIDLRQLADLLSGSVKTVDSDDEG